ncbi:MAG: flagellar export protein FliJ [Oscillospiraceae bacterium]|nr:flagellar export protein FliJ [Oscillospiraceae bacterium]
MKRFQFQLEPVLKYKEQTLDALMTELSEAQMVASAQEEARDRAAARLAEYDAEFAEKREAGFTIVEAMEYETGQRVLEQRLQREQQLLEQRQRELEAKRAQVVEARQETHAIEKLKQIRRGEYDAAAAKAEEKALDDLTAARRAMAAG